MISPKKLALLSLSGLLATGLAVGGATYAIFSSTATNSDNYFKAGKLQITAKRDDVPNVGPMFYTESVDGAIGAMPTGLWAPGDKHTRGLFLENTGSLEAKLTTLTATPTNSMEQPVSAASVGADLQAYNDDMLFAQQAIVKIWEIQEYDPIEGTLSPISTRMDSTTFDLVMNIINTGYNLWLQDHPNPNFALEQTVVSVLNYVNKYLLDTLNATGDSTNNTFFKVVRMYNQPLANLVNTPFDASGFNIKVPSGKAALLGYTVEFMKNPPAGIDPNSMQGKEVYFTFGSDWEQTANN